MFYVLTCGEALLNELNMRMLLLLFKQLAEYNTTIIYGKAINTNLPCKIDNGKVRSDNVDI